ncbi:hypothetical protein SERLA73DRAFT_180446, partial [Serpula lacrymans var. lacrymans S7.3]
YDSDFLLSVGEVEAASGRGRTDGFAVDKHLPSLTRVKSILSTHGDLCLFRFVRGDDHQQVCDLSFSFTSSWLYNLEYLRLLYVLYPFYHIILHIC